MKNIISSDPRLLEVSVTSMIRVNVPTANPVIKPVSEIGTPLSLTITEVPLRSEKVYEYATSSPNSYVEAFAGDVIVTIGAVVS